MPDVFEGQPDGRQSPDVGHKVSRFRPTYRALTDDEKALQAEVRAFCDEELAPGSYQPGRSICFVVTHPKPREIWAAKFRDRVVHHLLYNQISISGQALVFVVRTADWTLLSRAGTLTYIAFILAQVGQANRYRV